MKNNRIIKIGFIILAQMLTIDASGRAIYPAGFGGNIMPPGQLGSMAPGLGSMVPGRGFYPAPWGSGGRVCPAWGCKDPVHLPPFGYYPPQPVKYPVPPVHVDEANLTYSPPAVSVGR